MNEYPIGSRVSVCLLTYNHGHLIESTLRSILDQTIDGYEIIVSDDCSTDDTWEVVQRMAATDRRIRPVRTPGNLGMAGNANFAVAQSDRPYVALLHHDDIYRSDLLQRWFEMLDRHPTAAFVFNAYAVHQSDHVYREEFPGECMDGHWFLAHCLFPRWGCAVRGTAMVRRSVWLQAGGMKEEFGLLADVDLWMRLAMHWQVAYVSDAVIAVRQQRPEDYPETYKDNAWSWPRQRFLYRIHAINRLAYWQLQTPVGRLRWWGFRIRLSLETTKWLVYAVVRRKPAMIATCHDSATAYDLWPLPWLRTMLQRLNRP